MVVTTLDLANSQDVQAADAFIMARADGSPFHRPAWLRGVAQATGNSGLMLAAVAPSGRIVGLLPLHHVKSRLFGQALVSTGFAVDGGILADDPHVIAALALATQDIARDRGHLPIELRGGASPGGAWHRRDGSHVGFVRPLASDDTAELNAIPRKHRAELRKALANPALHVVHGRDARLLADHYHVYAQSVRNLGTPVFPAALFRIMLDQFGADADITIVYEGDRPISAVFTLYHRDYVMPYWGGGVADARRLRANELLYYRLMTHGRMRGMTLFDFGRSKAGSGQAAWKKSFGFVPRPLVYHEWSFTGATRDIDPNSARYKRRIAIWKRLPLWLANTIGPTISRGLG
ncbi:MAG: FemAB family PEP-CTERM system-associated protein [bacterium]|nr:FemAB family PEP-CTERM system-associated protein [bacterium]